MNNQIEMIQQNERVRAWVLIQGEDYEYIAKHIHGLDTKYVNKNDARLVVIRVDRVRDNEVAKIMAVIDADYGYFSTAQANIDEIVGPGNAIFYVVTAHNPDPPNNASGYITESEIPLSHITKPHAGRQDSSPGFNPWG